MRALVFPEKANGLFLRISPAAHTIHAMGLNIWDPLHGSH
jgi:hypothetical protein